ncbi:hypothetical protein P43SY_004005 [Pythium insidiosum]|uniref:Uncharacterized protein n=1 Tax=Pythium insidiosum TaxID=114742 RepID=A0AAD5Q737_PYTIN|nr:hypothetical protein P43SY_004005 [Pythium insidiosum]
MLRRLFQGPATSSRVLAVADDDDVDADAATGADAQTAATVSARHRSSSVRPTARSSFGLRSLVDATVDNTNVDDDDEDDEDDEADDAFDVDASPLPTALRPEGGEVYEVSARRRTRRISTVERLLVEKTSAMLSNPLAHLAVNMHREIKRRRQQVERATGLASFSASTISRSSILRPISKRLSRWSEHEGAKTVTTTDSSGSSSRGCSGRFSSPSSFST